MSGDGRKGAARILCGAVMALGLLAIPAGAWVLSFSYPAINDVSTDLVEPPEFTAAQEERGAGANVIDYPGERSAELQRQDYPDLKSLTIPRSAEESYELVLQALAKLKLKTRSNCRRRTTKIRPDSSNFPIARWFWACPTTSSFACLPTIRCPASMCAQLRATAATTSVATPSMCEQS